METLHVDLHRIAADIWNAMLGLDLEPDRPVDVHEPDERVVTGTVLITGDWEGAVTVQTTEQHAIRSTGLMMMMEEDEIEEEDVADTVGELANMAGGNVKGLLEGTCQLSLPSVTSGRDYHVSIPGTKVVQRSALDCEGELVVVSLLQRQNGAG